MFANAPAVTLSERPRKVNRMNTDFRGQFGQADLFPEAIVNDLVGAGKPIRFARYLFRVFSKNLGAELNSEALDLKVRYRVIAR